MPGFNVLPWYCGIHPNLELREQICTTREFPEETTNSGLGLDKSLSCYVVLRYEHVNIACHNKSAIVSQLD